MAEELTIKYDCGCELWVYANRDTYQGVSFHEDVDYCQQHADRIQEMIDKETDKRTL